MDFQQTIAEVAQELTDSGFVRETIKAQLQKTIKDTVENLFRSYGPVGEALKEQIQGEMVLNLKRLSVAGYGETLLPLIRERIDQTVIESAGGPIQKMLEKYLNKLEKKSWTLTEITDQFREDRAEYHQDSDDFYLEVEEMGKDSLFIGLDERSNVRSRYDAKYQLFVHKQELVQFTIDNRNITVHNATDLSGFDAFLFNLYANRCAVDVDDPSTRWRPDDY